MLSERQPSPAPECDLVTVRKRRFCTGGNLRAIDPGAIRGADIQQGNPVVKTLEELRMAMGNSRIIQRDFREDAPAFTAPSDQALREIQRKPALRLIDRARCSRVRLEIQ